MPKINVRMLALEITRDCNMSCCHCLRGEYQDVEIDPMTIRRALGGFHEISSITFTGGEPSLNPEAMECALETAEKREKAIYSVFIATNGKKVSDRFLAICDKWHYYCTGCDIIPYKYRCESGKELENKMRYLQPDQLKNNTTGMALALSVDNFHDDIDLENLIKLTSRAYFSDANMNTELFEEAINKSQKCIIDQGRASEYMPKDSLRQVKPYEYIDCEFDDDGTLTIDMLYVNAKGDILTCCDLSYESQDAYAICNINEPDWKETLYNRLKTLTGRD